MSDKFAMGSLGIGPFSGMLDSMEFVKQAWSTLSLPNNLTPTMDLDEIDRRIADLKVVEQWLTMNLGMLRSSIQGMEIQRGTIAAIRAFGEAMASPGEGVAATGAGAAAAGNASEPEDEAEDRAQPHAQDEAHDDSAAPSPQASPGSAPPQALGLLADEISKAAVAATNPAAWWKLLQSQFGQIAQAALSGAAHKAAVGTAAAPAASGPGSGAAAGKGAGAARKTTGSSRGARKGGSKKAAAKTAGSAGKRSGASGGASGRSAGRGPGKGARPAKG